MILIADTVLLIIYILYIKKLIKLIQTKEYQENRYFEHIKNHILETFFRLILQFVLMTIIYIGIKLYIQIDNIATIFFVSTFLLVNMLIIFSDSKKEQKLKYTKKIKFIYVSNIILIAAILLILTYLLKIQSLLQITYIGSLLMVFSPILTLLGHIIVKPKQNNIDIANQKQVVSKLKAFPKLIRIVVVNQDETKETSNGLKTMLNSKFNVLSIDIKETNLNLIDDISEKLKKENDILIVNLKNDEKLVEQICETVNPNYVFIALREEVDYEKIIEKAYEAITATGKVVVSVDKKGISKIIDKDKKPNTLTYGLKEIKANNVQALDVELQECQTSFILKIAEEEIECLTRIKGEVNIGFVSGICAIAYDLGYSLEEIKKGVLKI